MNLTLLVILCTTVFLIAFDVFIIYKKGKQESISAKLIILLKKYPAITLALGILLGHLTWSMRTDDIYPNVKCVEVKE